MTEISSAEQAYNAARRGQWRFVLLWVVPRDRNTGALEPTGFWTGPHDQQFVINGETRTYFGAGAALGVDDIPGGTGLDIRYVSAQLGLRSEAEEVIRGFDPKLAPVEVHTVAFDLDTGNLISEPRRIFKGNVNETPITTPAEGGDFSLEITLASSARALTRTLPLYRSDSELRRRSGTDRFRNHVSTSGLRQVAWGEKQVRNSTVSAPAVAVNAVFGKFGG